MSPDLTSASPGYILIVDDLAMNLRLLSSLLERNGYQVKKALSGKMALKAATINPPDLILLDVMMPEMDGYAVCKRFKALDRLRDIPIIFISALDETLDKIKAFEMGAVDYITKPFQKKEVLARVKNQLTIRSLQAQLQKKNQELTDQNLHLQVEITERKRAEAEIKFLLETTQSVNNAANFNLALEAIISSCCQLINWDFGEVWIPNQDRNLLQHSQSWYAKEANLSQFGSESLKLIFSPNTGLPGRIWSSKQPEWVEDFSTESKVASRLGLKAAFGVPIIVENQVLAVLIFFKKEVISLQPYLIELIQAVATQLGSLVQRKQAEEALIIAEKRYHSIVENAVDGIFQSTLSGRFISANMALARMYGYDSPEELIESIKDISRQIYVDPKRRQEFVSTMAINNAVYGFQSLVYRKDGETIWVSESARAVHDSQAKLLYYEGTVSDVTERKLAQEALKFQQQQSQQLLLNILPATIAKRLEREQKAIADSFDDVSVLFGDLVGFTEFCSSISPTKLVEFLNLIFSQFDQLAQKHNLEKIKTIGDAYMVVGSLPIPQSDHLEAIANMALDMQTSLDALCDRLGKSLSLRIGIHVGPVVAGVIGQTKFIYDLWGDTVNIASRMESSGITGEIQVSSVVYERLQEKFVFEERGQVSIKGKGRMTTYFLKGKADRGSQ